jgi:hypothetical protein
MNIAITPKDIVEFLSTTHQHQPHAKACKICSSSCFPETMVDEMHTFCQRFAGGAFALPCANYSSKMTCRLGSQSFGLRCYECSLVDRTHLRGAPPLALKRGLCLFCCLEANWCFEFNAEKTVLEKMHCPLCFQNQQVQPSPSQMRFTYSLKKLSVIELKTYSQPSQQPIEKAQEITHSLRPAENQEKKQKLLQHIDALTQENHQLQSLLSQTQNTVQELSSRLKRKTIYANGLRRDLHYVTSQIHQVIETEKNNLDVRMRKKIHALQRQELCVQCYAKPKRKKLKL